MGYEAISRTGQERGSAMGAHYRHTTPEMAARIATAIEQRLTVVLEVAEQALQAHPNRSTRRVFCGHGPRFLGKSLANGAQNKSGRCVVPVELRGFEPPTPCMPSRDPHHGAHHEPLRSKLLHQGRTAGDWWSRGFVEQSCCATAARNGLAHASTRRHIVRPNGSWRQWFLPPA